MPYRRAPDRCYLEGVGISSVRTAFGCWILGVLGAASPGCTVGMRPPPEFDTSVPLDGGRDAGTNDANDVNNDAGFDVGPPRPDVGPVDAFLTADAACESATSQATLTRSPADIIWVVDNSGSMAPAINAIQDGINGFAAQLVASDLDYRIIVLSLRTARSGRYPVCFPEPLAGPGCADNPPNFYQLEADIRSTQPIEQIIGTLAQTTGYQASDSIGSPPWRDLLRPGATRTFVVVSDDNQRTGASTFGTAQGYAPLTTLSLEDYPGGPNPFNGSIPALPALPRTLGPGILDATAYGDLFMGYTFDAIYGYGSETDPTVRCTPPSGPSSTFPASSGPTYTELVQRTGGVRAPICDPAADFPMFFDAIAASVVHGAPIECNIVIPPAPVGQTFQAGRVNVIIRSPPDQTYIPHVDDLAHCDATRGGWYYDDNGTPTEILLCPTSCDDARARVVGTATGLDVQFGCQSILI